MDKKQIEALVFLCVSIKTAVHLHTVGFKQAICMDMFTVPSVISACNLST